MWNQIHWGHVAVIFGGAVAGAETASRLSERGIYSIVFERAAVPWGKIEWGLPKWHARQRDQEEAAIDAVMQNPYVEFVPLTGLGRDVSLQEVCSWPASAVFLAVGAWRDRPLPVPGIDDYVGRGFCYQNPFVAWFNETENPAASTDGEYRIEDGAVVIGGGLASLDVAKILMLETTRHVLRRRGYPVDLFTLEKKGIPKVLEDLGLKWQDLGLKGCTLYYRRRPFDMPLVPLEEGKAVPEPEQIERVRVKVLETALRKYLFSFQSCSVPVDKLVCEDRLTGLVFQRTEVVGGKARPIPGTEFTVETPLVVSSIGSVPEPIPGIPMEGDLYALEDRTTCRVKGYPNVFAVGNVVTGTGNIKNSRMHARSVTNRVMDEFLQWTEADSDRLLQLSAAGDESKTEAFARENGLKSPSDLRRLQEIVRRYQARVGYTGDYPRWVMEHRPGGRDEE